MLASLVVAAAFSPAPLQNRRCSTSSAAAAAAAAAPRAALCLELPNIDGTGAFKNIQEYPCTLDIKVIGHNEGPFVSDMLTLAAENCGMDEKEIQHRWRDNGKFRSITLTLSFQNAEQVYAVYAAFDRDPRVRFKL